MSFPDDAESHLHRTPDGRPVAPGLRAHAHHVFRVRGGERGQPLVHLDQDALGRELVLLVLRDGHVGGGQVGFGGILEITFFACVSKKESFF